MAKQNSHEPLMTDVIGIVVGIGGIVVGYTYQFNDISYPSGDPRGEAWFGPIIFAIAAVPGFLILLVASIRLVQGLRNRRN